MVLIIGEVPTCYFLFFSQKCKKNLLIVQTRQIVNKDGVIKKKKKKNYSQ